VRVDFHPSLTRSRRYSSNKTALYIETRISVRHTTPLLLHMLEVVPPEWRFVFLGSEAVVEKINSSSPVQRYQELGKLRVSTIEGSDGNQWAKPWGGDDVGIDEVWNRLLTNRTFYERELRGVEWLLVFHSDSILCANSGRDVNEFLEWDWVGAPW
jgi:Protein of unknown function (DUF5672)